jgi:AcrR family transcriptional regulator
MSTARKTRAETAQETADRLLAVAAQAFMRDGAAGVSLDALAAEAGLTRGALHHHFTNKAGLFEAVLRRLVGELGARLDAAWETDRAAGLGRWPAFRRWFHNYLDAVIEPGLRRILLLEAPAVLGVKGIDILMDEGFGAMVEDLRRLIAAGRLPALDPVALGHLINGAVVNLAYWAAEAPPGEDRAAAAHAALAAMLDGLGRRAG